MQNVPKIPFCYVMEDSIQTKCANREAFPIVTSTKTVEDKCSETEKEKGKITMMTRRGKNRKVSKNAFFCERILLKLYLL